MIGPLLPGLLHFSDSQREFTCSSNTFPARKDVKSNIDKYSTLREIQMSRLQKKHQAFKPFCQMVLTFYWKISVVKIWDSGKTYIRFMSFFNPQGKKNKPPSFKHCTHCWLMFRAMSGRSCSRSKILTRFDFNLYTFPTDDEVREKNTGCEIPCSLQLCLAFPVPHSSQ